VSKENIITLGASKGGSAALYYGLRMNVGYIIAAGPPIYWSIFNSCYQHQVSFFHHVAGGLSEEDNHYMDCILENMAQNNDKTTTVHFLSITNDIYYEGYLDRFLKLLQRVGIKYTSVVKDGNGHGDLPKYIIPWVYEVLHQILI